MNRLTGHLLHFGMLVILCGCGGGGAGGPSGGSPAAIKPNVKALSNTVSYAVDGATVTLTGTVPPINPGDVIVSGQTPAYCAQSRRSVGSSQPGRC